MTGEPDCRDTEVTFALAKLLAEAASANIVALGVSYTLNFLGLQDVNDRVGVAYLFYLEYRKRKEGCTW